jgi:hypothetical protein
MIFDTGSLDVQVLEHFHGGEAMVLGHSGGQTLLDFSYVKPVSLSTVSCMAFPWCTCYDDNEESEDDDAPLSGDEAAPPSSVLPVSAPPAPSMALTPFPPPVASPAPLYPALPASALPVSVLPSSALLVSRILALEVAWFASPQPGGMQARI